MSSLDILPNESSRINEAEENQPQTSFFSTVGFYLIVLGAALVLVIAFIVIYKKRLKVSKPQRGPALSNMNTSPMELKHTPSSKESFSSSEASLGSTCVVEMHASPYIHQTQCSQNDTPSYLNSVPPISPTSLDTLLPYQESTGVPILAPITKGSISRLRARHLINGGKFMTISKFDKHFPSQAPPGTPSGGSEFWEPLGPFYSTNPNSSFPKDIERHRVVQALTLHRLPEEMPPLCGINRQLSLLHRRVSHILKHYNSSPHHTRYPSLSRHRVRSLSRGGGASFISVESLQWVNFATPEPDISKGTLRVMNPTLDG